MLFITCVELILFCQMEVVKAFKEADKGSIDKPNKIRRSLQKLHTLSHRQSPLPQVPVDSDSIHKQ